VAIGVAGLSLGYILLDKLVLPWFFSVIRK
jgi:hypothetical protein